jgi:hypothetical protein
MEAFRLVLLLELRSGPVHNAVDYARASLLAFLVRTTLYGGGSVIK